MNKYNFNIEEKTIILIGSALVVVWLVLVVLWLARMMNKYTWNEEVKRSEAYIKETLNMPRGTLRGVLTLTLLVVVVILVCVSMFVTQLKGQFDSMVNAFELMIAFYFGSKVMHHVTSSDKEKNEKKATAEAQKAKYNSAVPNQAEPFDVADSVG